MRIAHRSIEFVVTAALPLLLGWVTLLGSGWASAETVRVGDPAPAFSFVGTDGLAYDSSRYLFGRGASSGRATSSGRSTSSTAGEDADAKQTAQAAKAQARAGEPGRGVVIAWFPKAFTGG